MARSELISRSKTSTERHSGRSLRSGRMSSEIEAKVSKRKIYKCDEIETSRVSKIGPLGHRVIAPNA